MIYCECPQEPTQQHKVFQDVLSKITAICVENDISLYADRDGDMRLSARVGKLVVEEFISPINGDC
jgi:hypothetical protein